MTTGGAVWRQARLDSLPGLNKSQKILTGPGIIRLSHLVAVVSVGQVRIPDQPVKRIVVHETTGEFLTSDGKWTRDESQAVNFNDITRLMLACSKFHIRNAEVVLRYKNARKREVRLPLRSSRP